MTADWNSVVIGALGEAGSLILRYRPLLGYAKLGLRMTTFIGLTLDFHIYCQGDVDEALRK